MHDDRSTPPPGAPMDRDLNLRGIVVTVIALAVVLVASAAVVWPLLRGFYDMVAAADPPPPALPEARIQQPPPEPRLQADPVADMDALRAEEERLLTGWQWLDSQRARVPVERAMEIVLERGLDAALPPATPVGAEPASGAEEDGR